MTGTQQRYGFTCDGCGKFVSEYHRYSYPWAFYCCASCNRALRAIGLEQLIGPSLAAARQEDPTDAND